MENSILTSTKKILGLDESYEAFDLDVITHLNLSLSVLDQLGIGPSGGIFIEDKNNGWDELGLPDNILSMVKTYIYLKVRFLFDPPTTSFLIDATKNQIDEYENRLTFYEFIESTEAVSRKPLPKNLYIYRGDDYEHDLIFTDDSTPAAPLNLSAYTFKAQIRDRSSNGELIAEFTIDTSDSVNGVIVLKLTSEETQILTSGYWDLEVNDGVGIDTWAKGRVNVSGDVTQDGP